MTNYSAREIEKFKKVQIILIELIYYRPFQAFIDLLIKKATNNRYYWITKIMKNEFEPE